MCGLTAKLQPVMAIPDNSAFNGLENIVWGVGGVTEGDTLWVCSTHASPGTFWDPLRNTITIGASGSDGSRITIRGDVTNAPDRVT